MQEMSQGEMNQQHVLEQEDIFGCLNSKTKRNVICSPFCSSWGQFYVKMVAVKGTSCYIMHFFSLLWQSLIWLLKWKFEFQFLENLSLFCRSQKAALMLIHWSWNSFGWGTGSAHKKQLVRKLEMLIPCTSWVTALYGPQSRNIKG